jgi:uncharacterized transporter YbjL
MICEKIKQGDISISEAEKVGKDFFDVLDASGHYNTLKEVIKQAKNKVTSK